MPALELAQETGKVMRWLKAPGDPVRKGEPLVEIETDKVTVEIEAPAVRRPPRGDRAGEGDVVPVGQTIALIFGAGEASPARRGPRRGCRRRRVVAGTWGRSRRSPSSPAAGR